MSVLNWIGKDAVVVHDAQVPFRLLHDVPELACGNGESGNLIVEGDNLLALKALLPHYGGQVKCIYIDPPYNTGNEGWVYNDAVNSPQMREWLGKVVGKEAEDLTRHLWERRSGGRCAFAWVDRHGDWTALRDAALRCASPTE